MTVPTPADDLPSLTPSPAELADLELLLSGAYQPLSGFLGSTDVAAVVAGGRLADGTPWPVPVTLSVPERLAAAERVLLTDAEGAPLALLRVGEAWRGRTGDPFLAGTVEESGAPEHGPFRRLRRRPDAVRAEFAANEEDRPVLAVARRTPLHRRELGRLRHAAEKLGAAVLVLALTEPDPAAGVAHREGLIRMLLAARRELPDGSRIVTLPLARHPDADHDLLVRAHVAAAYGATHLLDEAGQAHDGPAGAPVEIVVTEPWAFDGDLEVWRPVAKIEPEHVRADLTEEELNELLAQGDPVPDWFTPPAVAEQLRRAVPARCERGLTVFFTGLSGSGKSTIARGLSDALVERGGRTTTLLDGDVVRRLLSAGLTFSRADRDLNIRRIGFVAAEITRHGGIAICAPIAPYASTREEVRRMVGAVGDFVLVHVATPLAECERRDRKGLYAKARAGLITEFTGVSDPYEEPNDADLVLDTTHVTVDEAVGTVLALLDSGGWVRSDAL